MIIATAKSIIGLAASVGAGQVVTNVIRTTTPYQISKVGKVLTGVGGFVIGTMVGDAASKYAEGRMTEMAEQVKDVMNKAKENKSKLKEVK